MIQLRREVHQQKRALHLAEERRGVGSPPLGEHAQEPAKFGQENRMEAIGWMVELDHDRATMMPQRRGRDGVGIVRFEECGHLQVSNLFGFKSKMY